MLRPINDNIIVKPIKGKDQTDSGIILPNSTNEEKPEQGEVIAVGPGKFQENGQRMPMTVKQNDKIIFTKYSPNEININGQDYLVLKESDVLAIID